MAVKRLSNARLQYDDGNGALASGYRLFFYAAGSSTKQNTYNSSSGSTPNTNPIVLNALGEPAVEIWLSVGLNYKMGLAIPGSDDPPSAFIWTEDNISAVNDATGLADQWIASGLTPTYVSPNVFTLVGDQTAIFHVGRRIKTLNTAGTRYSTITASVFGAVTTITSSPDSGVIDSGLSAVSYGLLSATNPSTPVESTLPFFSADGLGSYGFSYSSGIVAVTGMFPTYISGFTMSTAGGSASLSVAGGVTVDAATGGISISGGNLIKTTSAWAAGNGGGLDTGAIANNTWYHWYVIQKGTSGTAVDILFSLNFSAPNVLPATYTRYRRIGSAKTNGSAQWIAFTQYGGEFRWAVPVMDYNATNPGTAAVLSTLTVPTGIQVMTRCSMGVRNQTTSPIYALFTSPDQTDTTPTSAIFDVICSSGAGSPTSSTSKPIWTNTSAQVRSRLSASGAADQVFILTDGWFDPRGQT